MTWCTANMDGMYTWDFFLLSNGSKVIIQIENFAAQMSAVSKSGFSNVQAYYAVAQRLKEHVDLKIKRGRLPEDLVGQLDSSLTEARRVLKQKLGEAGAADALTSQLLSVLSSEQSLDERLQATFETILPWASEITSGIPLEVRHMYA